MPAVRMAITPPAGSYLRNLPIESSTSSVHILALHELDTQSRGILEIRPPNDDIQPVAHFLESHEAIDSAEVLYSDGNIGLVQYTTLEPLIFFAALEAGATPVFPVEIHNGQMLIEAIMSYDRISGFEDALEMVDASCDIRFIKQSPDADAIKQPFHVDNLLTVRQQQILLEAVERGYYDTPRQCTLTELAGSLNISKGAASGLLHRAEEQIVKEFVANLSGKSVER